MHLVAPTLAEMVGVHLRCALAAHIGADADSGEMRVVPQERVLLSEPCVLDRFVSKPNHDTPVATSAKRYSHYDQPVRSSRLNMGAGPLEGVTRVPG